jgi:hypothetical protein
MKSRFRKLAFLALFLVMVPLVSRTWAAFGPCTVYRAGGLAPVASPIGCYQNILSTLPDCFCGGKIVIVPEASACSNTNSIVCTEVNVEALITYGSDGSDCMTWRYLPLIGFYPTCGGTCFQDLTTGWPTWGTPLDTSCN